MYKKLLISMILILAIICSFSICFANNGLQEVANGVRNAVGDAENAVEGAARDISNASKDATGDVENKANEIGNGVKGAANNAVGDMNNYAKNMTTNDVYTATRTATGAESNTFMGMNSTAWTWLILGIAAIAIIALVWYYSMQLSSSNHNRD